MHASVPTSTAALLAAIVAIILAVLAAVLFLGTNDAGTQRLGIFVGLVAIVLPQLVAMLRGDQAAQTLDGTLDERIAAGVLRANYVRRASDVTPDTAAPRGREAIDNPSTLAPVETVSPEDGG